MQAAHVTALHPRSYRWGKFHYYPRCSDGDAEAQIGNPPTTPAQGSAGDRPQLSSAPLDSKVRGSKERDAQMRGPPPPPDPHLGCPQPVLPSTPAPGSTRA